MNDFAVKKALSKRGGQSNNAPAASQSVNGIPNSVLADVFAGKRQATNDMMGHREELAPSIAAKMSRSFGMDFSAVKVYRSDAMVGTEMHGMAQGDRVVLSSDVDLNTMEGQATLGHELSHIRAQSMGMGSGLGLLNDASLEHQADSEGMLAARGMNISGESMGMSMGLGMAGVENLSPIGAGLSASAGAPMQALKVDRDAERLNALSFKNKNDILTRPEMAEYDKLRKKLRNRNRSLKTDDQMNRLAGDTLKPMAPLLNPEPVPQAPDSPDWAELQSAADAKDEKRISDAYDILSEQQYQQMTQVQADAFRDYIEDSEPVNSVLRGTKKRSSWTGYQISRMDQGMQTTGGNLRAYRGVSDLALIAAIRQSPKLAKKLLTPKGTIDYTRLEENPELLNGMEFSDEGYSSTSLKESFAESWRKGILGRDAKYRSINYLLEHHLEKDLKNPASNAFSIAQGFSSVPKNRKDYDNLNPEEQHLLTNLMGLDHLTEREVTLNEKDMINEGYGSHLYDINVPKGTRATMIDKTHPSKTGEDNHQRELLLDRGTRFKITGLQKMLDKNGVPLKNQYRILMDVVSQKKKKV